MGSRGNYTPWCDVRAAGRMLALRDESGDVDEAEALREKFRRMPTAELAALDGTTASRDEVIAASIEACFRGLLDEVGQAHLLKLLDEDEKRRAQREEDRTFRHRHGGLSREEVAEMGGAR